MFEWPEAKRIKCLWLSSLLKDPIIGVDVTADGKWILATCKTYLIVINAEIKDSGVTGFSKSMGQNKVSFFMMIRTLNPPEPIDFE